MGILTLEGVQTVWLIRGWTVELGQQADDSTSNAMETNKGLGSTPGTPLIGPCTRLWETGGGGWERSGRHCCQRNQADCSTDRCCDGSATHSEVCGVARKGELWCDVSDGSGGVFQIGSSVMLGIIAE